jgi:xanthine/CO dehydrogenase XdhC/CoxF family maturation factor
LSLTWYQSHSSVDLAAAAAALQPPPPPYKHPHRRAAELILFAAGIHTQTTTKTTTNQNPKPETKNPPKIRSRRCEDSDLAAVIAKHHKTLRLSFSIGDCS